MRRAERAVTPRTSKSTAAARYRRLFLAELSFADMLMVDKAPLRPNQTQCSRYNCVPGFDTAYYRQRRCASNAGLALSGLRSADEMSRQWGVARTQRAIRAGVV